MPTSYKEYESRIITLENFPSVIEDARKEYAVKADKTVPVYNGQDIPLNLERKYIDALLELKDFNSAKRILERMKISYVGFDLENLLESYEYRLQLIEKTEKLFESERLNLKQELNQHNLATVSIIVGVITIFGVAGQTLIAKNFIEGLSTFFAIVSAICFLTIGAFWANNYFGKKL